MRSTNSPTSPSSPDSQRRQRSYRGWARLLPLLDPLGKILLIFSVSMLPPALLAAAKGEPARLVGEFLLPAAVIAGLGALGWRFGRGHRAGFKVRHATLLVLIIWFVLPLIAAMPLIGHIASDQVLIDAYFEAVSGLTASGATVMSGIDELPDAIKLWRGEISWMGGMGLIVLAVAILPSLGVGGRQLMFSEFTGPGDQELTPRINDTAKGLWMIYAGLTGACLLAYFASGMNLLDAIVHSFTTMALGGFSNYDNSFGHFDSVLIESVAIVFMVAAGFNFATHFGFARNVWRVIDGKRSGLPGASGKLRLLAPYLRDAELKPYLVTLAAGIVVVVAVLLLITDTPVWTAIRHAAFNTVSIATTTGYSSIDFAMAWPLLLSIVLLVLANFTSCSGSTGGGLKMIRARIAYDQLHIEQQRILHPNSFQQVKVGSMVVDARVVNSVLFFVLAYLSSGMFLALLLLAAQPELDLLTAISAAYACLSNTGPGLGEVGPGTTYASLNPIATLICALGMLLGRLELLVFLLLFSRELWR